MKPRRFKRLILVGWTFTCLVLGGSCFAYVAFLRMQVKDVLERWQPVSAKVISSAVEGKNFGDTGRSSYRPDIRFSYVVDGTGYTGGRYQVVDDWRSERDAWDGVVARYRPGREVEAWYDPDDPAQAVLVRGETESSLPMVLGTVSGLVGIAFSALLVITSKRRSSPRRA